MENQKKYSFSDLFEEKDGSVKVLKNLDLPNNGKYTFLGERSVFNEKTKFGKLSLEEMKECVFLGHEEKHKSHKWICVDEIQEPKKIEEKLKGIELPKDKLKELELPKEEPKKEEDKTTKKRGRKKKEEKEEK